MAIQESDIMDFGNGIIGDDTFDVWRKKTNSLKGEIDLVNTTLTNKINTDVASLRPLYIPIAGTATTVSTSLQFTSPLTLTNILNINGVTLTGSTTELASDKGFHSSIQLTSPKVKATSKLILGTKEYTVPSSPAINNAVLTSATTAGELQWRNAAELFSDAGGLQQTTAVFEEVMPVGAVIACAEDPNDPNFLECNGGSVPKSGVYNKLYEVLKGTAATARYGETTTTFALPNYSGRVLVGTGTAGSVNFGTTFGVDGGDTTTNTGLHKLTAAQSGLPSHNHVQGHNSTTGVQGRFGNTTGLANGNISDVTGSIGVQNTGANTSTAGGTDATSFHSHNIPVGSRIQPYVTVKYYIKAIENSKVDFKINVNNGGLKSTDGGATPQTLISVSNQTHTLSVDPDNTSIALDNNFKVSVKSSPTIQGTITATGNVISDEPTESNHLATKNYVDNRQDTTRGNFKKETETESGKHHSVSPQFTRTYCYIDDEDNVVFKGKLSGGLNIPSGANSAAINRAHSSDYVSLTKLLLPDNEKADKLYKSFYNTFVISKSGKAYSIGLGYSAASTTLVVGAGVDDQKGNRYYTWTRAFCTSNNCKISKIIVSADRGNENVYALDTNGYLWGHGNNKAGQLANGTVHSTWDIDGNTKPLSATTLKRFELLNSETLALGADKAYALEDLGPTSAWRLSQVMNHMVDATGQITHDPALAVRLLKVTDGCAIGGFTGYGTGSTGANPYNEGYPYETIAILGEDRRVYTAGHSENGQGGAGTSTFSNPFWATVSTSQDVPLENITKLYAGGQKRGTFFVALDEDHDAWAWGYGHKGNFSKGLFGIASNEGLYATRMWDSSVRNRRANYVITQTAGGGYSNFAANQQGQGVPSGDQDGTLIIASHQDSAGNTIDKEFYMRNEEGTAIVQITHTVFNTATYSIQELYHSNGARVVNQNGENNFYFVLARNKNTNLLEIWSSGSNTSQEGNSGVLSGALGYRSPGRTTYEIFNAGNPEATESDWRTIAHRVNFPSELLEKVVNIHCSVAKGQHYTYETSRSTSLVHTRETATYIYLSDGRIFATGHSMVIPIDSGRAVVTGYQSYREDFRAAGEFAPIEMHL